MRNQNLDPPSDGLSSTHTAVGSDTVDDTENTTVLVQMEEEKRSIRTMPFVTTLSPVRVSQGHSRNSRLKEVIPPALDATGRGGFRTRGPGLRSLEDMVPKRFVLSVDDDTEFRSRCE